MKPSKKREGPDPMKPEIEISQEIGGTNGDTIGEEQRWEESSIEGDEGSGGGYGRPQEQGDDDQDA
jgi:hypothetical protein